MTGNDPYTISCKQEDIAAYEDSAKKALVSVMTAIVAIAYAI